MKWIESDSQWLIENGANVSVQTICDILGHSEVTVRMQARKLGVTLKGEPQKKLQVVTFVAMSIKDTDLALA